MVSISIYLTKWICPYCDATGRVWIPKWKGVKSYHHHLKQYHPKVYSNRAIRPFRLPSFIYKRTFEVKEEKKEKDMYLYKWQCPFCKSSGREFTEYLNSYDNFLQHLYSIHPEKERNACKKIFIRKRKTNEAYYDIKIETPKRLYITNEKSPTPA